MKVLAIQSSPNEDGLTRQLAQSALKGAQEAGADTELVHLNKLDIRLCQACARGWGVCRDEGKCAQEDDFEGLRGKINVADALIFSTPVYFGDITESAKVLLDRLRRVEVSKHGNSPLKGKPIIGIASAGGSGGGAVNALHNLEGYLRWFQFTIWDLVPVTQRNKEWKIRALYEAGKNLVEGE